MYEKYKNSYKVTEKELVSLSVYNVGFQRCDSLYQWGPGIRDHYLIHYIISGKGFYKIGKRTYELQAGDSFLVYPNTEVVYYAAETDPEVSTVLEQYYTALGARDINGLFAVTDNLTAEEQAQIEAESDVESYGDVKAYTISGPSDGTYIAFVSSRCKYLGINQTLPMLSEYYLYTTEDGSLKIMDDTDSDAAVTEAMKAALENEEVKNLIEQVQNDYQNALDADASLRAYVESIQ